MQRGNLALASAPASNATDLAGSAAARNSEQELLGRLRQIRATGRIVLEFKAGSNGLDVLPDIALEDGDRFVVPSVPASVNVVGSVYDQNSFLFEAARRAGTYLHLAGGPNQRRRHEAYFHHPGGWGGDQPRSGEWNLGQRVRQPADESGRHHRGSGEIVQALGTAQPA